MFSKLRHNKRINRGCYVLALLESASCCVLVSNIIIILGIIHNLLAYYNKDTSCINLLILKNMCISMIHASFVDLNSPDYTAC